jgi:ABC-type phosphate/phosphonate transport system substrate-binding protein
MIDRTITRRHFFEQISALAAAGAIGLRTSAWGERRPFTVAMSLETLAGANVNDARAAYKVWSLQIAAGLALHSEIVPETFVPSAQLIQMIRAAEVDCFAITAWEYSKLVDLIDPSLMMVEDYATDGIDYLLLVHNSSSYQKVEDLRGATIVIHHHRDTNLLEAWLSVLLADKGMPAADQFFGGLQQRDNLNDVILPLFFRRTQAVGVTRRAFNAAVELNPQLGRDLRVLAASPRIVSDGFFFRLGCDAKDKHQFQDALFKFQALPAGRQCMALYQSTGFYPRPCTIMNGSLDLIHRFERLHKTTHHAAG